MVRHALESFIRRRFFVVHLGLLAIAAILCARMVTVVAGHAVAEKLQGQAGGKGDRRPATLRSTGTTRDFTLAANANIFEGKRELVTTAATTAGPRPDGNDCDVAPRSALRLRLVGTVVFTEQEASMASIVDESKGGTASMFSINECMSAAVDQNDPNSKLAAGPNPCNRVGDSAVLQRIEPERVCILNETESRMEYLAIDEPPEKGGASPIVARADKEPSTPVSSEDADIKKVSENGYEVGQKEVDKALNNLAELSTQARIVPAFEGGKTVGFKLFSIRPGSLYSKIGLQNGDVITRINGYEMSSPEKGLEIYTKLKDAKQVTVDLKRRGKPQTLDYTITQ